MHLQFLCGVYCLDLDPRVSTYFTQFFESVLIACGYAAVHLAILMGDKGLKTSAAMVADVLSAVNFHCVTADSAFDSFLQVCFPCMEEALLGAPFLATE